MFLLALGNLSRFSFTGTLSKFPQTGPSLQTYLLFHFIMQHCSLIFPPVRSLSLVWQTYLLLHYNSTIVPLFFSPRSVAVQAFGFGFGICNTSQYCNTTNLWLTYFESKINDLQYYILCIFVARAHNKIYCIIKWKSK